VPLGERLIDLVPAGALALGARGCRAAAEFTVRIDSVI
jgi:hypothetical protein